MALGSGAQERFTAEDFDMTHNPKISIIMEACGWLLGDTLTPEEKTKGDLPARVDAQRAVVRFAADALRSAPPVLDAGTLAICESLAGYLDATASQHKLSAPARQNVLKVKLAAKEARLMFEAQARSEQTPSGPATTGDKPAKPGKAS